jgi:parallel beta-helix repeat protein
MRLYRASIVLVMLAGGLTLAHPAAAASLTVPSGAFPTIQSAVDAAGSGDVINIKPGTYNETVVVTTAIITIQKKPKTKGTVIVDGFDPTAASDETFDIDATGFRLTNVTVRNGEDDSIECDGNNCEIRKVRVLSSVVGDCINITGAGAIVSGSVLRSCADNAIEITGAGSVVSGNNVRLSNNACVVVNGSDALVQKNTIGQCEDLEGLTVSGQNPRVLSNKVSGPTDTVALHVACSVSCGTGAVSGNVVTNGAEDDDGIAVSVAAGLGSFDIIGNTVVRSLEHGFDLDVSDGVIKNNIARENGAEKEDGFSITGDNNSISGNKAIGNGGAGFTIDGIQNVLTRNVASNNGVEGIKVTASSATTLDRNTATGNQADGIENDGASSVLTNNRSRNNKLDCTGDVAPTTDTGNSCADGTSFSTTPGSGID